MPRRISDYPDVYYGWNQIASIGSLISVIASLLVFFIVADCLCTPFLSKKCSVHKLYVN